MLSLCSSSSTSNPPFPIIEQTPIVAEDVSLSALEETGEARFAVLEEMAHQDRFVRPSVLNWSISSEEMKEGRCLVAEMGCPGSADLHIKQRVDAYFRIFAHLIELR